MLKRTPRRARLAARVLAGLLLFVAAALIVLPGPTKSGSAPAAQAAGAPGNLGLVSSTPKSAAGCEAARKKEAWPRAALAYDSVDPTAPDLSDSGSSFFVGLEEGRFLPPSELAKLGLEQAAWYPQTGTAVLRPTGGKQGASDYSDAEAEQVVRALLRLPGVRWAEQGRPRYVTRLPNDEYYPLQWGPPVVRLPGAWDITTGREDVVVAVLDSGVAQDIPDFSGRIVSPYSTKYDTSESWAWEDIFGHGSGVAGVAAAAGDNRVGIAGTAWQVKIMPVHFTDDGRVSDEDYIEAIYYAADHGAKVINISYGSRQPFRAEQEAVSYALSKGIVVVAAVGNGGLDSGVQYPAAIEGVIAVGAVGQVDGLLERASFSSTGPGIDLVAPGKNVLTYDAGTTWYRLTYLDGTSYAAPHVAGVAALMLSIAPELRPEQIHSILTATAKDMGPSGYDTYYGYGLLDAQAALAQVTAATTTTLPPTTTTSTISTTTTTTSVAPIFSDVPPDHPYAEAIAGLARAGIVSGYVGGTFGPDEPVLRAQFAKMICGTLDLPVAEGMIPPFRDLGPDSPLTLYPHQYVAAAAEYGITVGVATGIFAPWLGISRAQVVTMTVRAALKLIPHAVKMPPPGFQGALGMFDREHGETMQLAEYNNLLAGLVGYGKTWNPWQTATRGEVADILWRLRALR